MTDSTQRPSPRPLPPIPGVAHVVAIASGKGGVGKSTVSTNLAIALAQAGQRVGLLDLDIYGPNQPTMFGTLEDPQVQEAKEGQPELFIPPVSFGVKLMSMGFLMDPEQAAVWRGPMLHKAVQQLSRQVEWGELDYLLVDLPPGTGDVQLSLAQTVPLSGAVVVTTPQEVALQDVRKALSMFELMGTPVTGVVENMSYFEAPDTGKRYYLFGEGGGKHLAEKYSLPLLGQIPLAEPVRKGGDEGYPITVADPENPVSQAFTQLAEGIVAGRTRLGLRLGEGADGSSEAREDNPNEAEPRS